MNVIIIIFENRKKIFNLYFIQYKDKICFLKKKRQKKYCEASAGYTYSRKSTENLFIYFVMFNQDNKLDLEFLRVAMVNCQLH